MQLRVCRSASVAACVAVLAAAAAGSAQAAVTAVTGPATNIKATSAILNGTVSTGGKVTQWQFTYNLANNPLAGGFTDSGIIPAGTTVGVGVTAAATGLTPGTAYTYQLVASDVTFGVNYYLLALVYGGTLSFTTGGPGTASLTSTKLKVKKGRVVFKIKCSKALDCTGGVVDVTTRHKGKTVACGSATFTVKAGKTKTINTSKVSKKCHTLLAAAKKKTIKAKLTASFAFQNGFTKTVHLKLNP
ncbi:MAG: hypothetical protein QOJ25_1209 [Solirubrobacteraceae bacterium]|nr:hypothetical protein [Solirubrobacteraceae bacterium]